MNRLEYYDRQKEAWLEDELQALRSRYENRELTISQIGDAHRRRPGSISYMLKKIGIITHNAQARGYPEYVSSDLYKSILNADTRTEYERTIQKPNKITTQNTLARKGKKWDDDEVLKLLTSIQKKKSIADIAVEHERSPGAINSERKKLAADYWFNDKKSVEYISKWTGLSKDEIEEAIERRQLKDQSRTERADAKTSLTEQNKQQEQQEKQDIDEESALLKEYTNAGTPWTVQETADLIVEYNERKMSLLDLSLLHKRLPTGIIARLKMHKIIQTYKDVRGYIEYRLSDLWKEIAAIKSKANKAKRVETTVVNLHINKKSPASLELEVSELKDEVKILKARLNELQKGLAPVVKRNVVNVHLA